MSDFFSKKYSSLVPYTPGEQPQDMKYIKLNTNESPFPPSSSVMSAVAEEVGKLQLYSDPECKNLRKAMADFFNVNFNQIVMVNGSDEALNFAFMAFAEGGIVFPEITYGFYPVFAKLNGIDFTEVPQDSALQINPNDYKKAGKCVCIANPNAPTGQFIPVSEIEEIVKSNVNNVVIIDEAYINFGGQSAIPLVKKYGNLLVVGTFSKSHSLAGGRLGYAIGDSRLVDDINTIRYSTNPYNVNRMTAAAGIAALQDNDYYINNCKIIQENRAWTQRELERLGFEVLPSKANFLFVRSPKIAGDVLYKKLKERGILIRHFTIEKTSDYNRITIGTMEQMNVLIENIEKLLAE